MAGRDLKKAQHLALHRHHNQYHLQVRGGENTFSIPLTSETVYLGAKITYYNLEGCTVTHRIHCAWITHRRLAIWLHRRKLPVHLRYRIWHVSVFSSLVYSTWTIGHSQASLRSLITCIRHMLRKVLGDFSQITHRTHQQAFAHAHIASPEQLLLESAIGFQRTLVHRNQWTHADDIVHWGKWSHLTDTITLLTAPHVPTTLPDNRQMFQYRCDHCDYSTYSPSLFHRHNRTHHNLHRYTQFLTNPYVHALHGTPQCKHCYASFGDWPAFRAHIVRNCCRAVSAMEAPAIDPALKYSTLQPGDLRYLNEKPWGASLLQAVAARDWTAVKDNIPACTSLAIHCILCGTYCGRVQKLNAHHKQCHLDLMHNVLAMAHDMGQTHASTSPCGFCGKPFRTHHQCPVITQLAILVGNRYGATQEDPQHKCELCQMDFPDREALQHHRRFAHRVGSSTFVAARDSVAGQPVCSHCFSMHANVESLRRHITGGHCPSFDVHKEPELLPLKDAITAHLKDGTLRNYLQDPKVRDELTHTCLQCDQKYGRPGDLALHLQTAQCALHQEAHCLVNLFNHTARPDWGCICQPKVKHLNDLHNCLPVRQLSMHAKRCDLPLIHPLPTNAGALTKLLHPLVPQITVDQIIAAYVSRTFEELWNPPLTGTLRQQCLRCGQRHSPLELRWHVTTEHPKDLQWAKHYLPQVANHLAQFCTDEHCFACGMPFPVLADVPPLECRRSHFLAQCPSTLQVGIILAAAHHGIEHTSRGDGGRRDSGGAPTLRDLWQAAGSPAGRAKKEEGSSSHRGRRPKHNASPVESIDDTGAEARSGNPGSKKPRLLGVLHDGGTEGMLGPPADSSCPVAKAGEEGDATPPALGSADAGPDDPAHTAAPGCLSPGQPEGGSHPTEGLAAGPHTPIPLLGPCHSVPAGGCEEEAPDPGQGGDSPDRVPAVCEGNRADCAVPIPVDDSPEQSDDMEAADTDQGRPLPRALGVALESEPMAAGRHQHEGPFPAHERAGTTCVEPQWRQDYQRWWQGQFAEGKEQTAFQVQLRKQYTQLVLTNYSQVCYANATILATLWMLLSQKGSLAWGPRAATFAALLKHEGFVPLSTFKPFGPLFAEWHSGGEHGQADATEFLMCALSWLEIPAPIVNHRWEKRWWCDNKLELRDLGDIHTPLILDFETFATEHEVQLTTLLHLWHQEHGMTKALTSCPTAFNIQLDRFKKNAKNEITKIECAVRLPEELQVPIFMDRQLTVQWESYTPVAFICHYGTATRGHYNALLHDFFHHIAPWVVTEDNYIMWRHARIPEYLEKHLQSLWLIKTSELLQPPNPAINTLLEHF
eukprot:Skav212673  [mRNA]  locus=scaffold1227:738576:742562:+ [translate_table: standard]